MNWNSGCGSLARLCATLFALALIPATAALANEPNPPFVRGWAVDVAAEHATPPWTTTKFYDSWGPRFTFSAMLPADFELGLFVVWPTANGGSYDHASLYDTTFRTLTVGGRARYSPHWKVAPVVQAGMGVAATWYESSDRVFDPVTGATHAPGCPRPR